MNQRPFLLLLAAFVLGEVWIWQFQRSAAVAALILVSFFLFGTGIRKKSSLFLLAAIGLLLGGLTEWRWQKNQTAFARWKDQDISYVIKGQIEERKEGEETTALTLKKLEIKTEEEGKEWSSLKGKLLVYVENGKDYGLGYRIRIRGKIQSFSPPSNPGQWNQVTYREARGILGCCYEADVQGLWYGSFLIGDGLRSIREQMAAVYQNRLTGSQAGTALAMVLGDKSGLLEEQKQLYQLGGISHILAVSGLHMTLMGAGIYRLLRKAGTGYGIAVFVSFPCILCYAMLTGNSASCLRASFMLLVYLFGEWLGRSYDFLSSLSLAGLLLLIEIPARLFDSGFLLSFGAVLGIGIFYPAVEETLFPHGLSKLPGPVNKLVSSLTASASLTIFTLPLSLFFFHGVSLAGIIWNLAVIPLMNLLFPMLFLGGILCLGSPGAAGSGVFAVGGAFRLAGQGAAVGGVSRLASYRAAAGGVLLFGGGKMIDFYELLCNLSEKIPGAYLTLGYRNIGFALIYYSILGLFLFSRTGWFQKNKFSFGGIRWLYSRIAKHKIHRVFHLGIMVSLLFLIFITYRWDTYFTMLDVGQGDGLLFHCKSGETVAIDGGSTSKTGIGSYVLKPAFSYYGISKIDDWILSHTDEDHISGLVELLEAGYPIGRLILPRLSEQSEKEEELCLLAKQNQTEVVFLEAGDCIRFSEGELFCLHPQKTDQASDSNENSLVFLLSLPHQEFLLTGDIGTDVETIVNPQIKSVSDREKERILKVAHHGSKGSSGEAFLSAYQPDLCLISCGKNNRYGHPASEALERLSAVTSSILRTDQIGAIEIRCGVHARYFVYGEEKD